ncbi:Putative dienelactone hydrolase [Gloeomargarita lithophora Alchichica-D10]|uniref:Dienelactone hydrolase n=1 Tax=Gloeomargarita lithophora Alchichica-D10 TaxID=1188229 RepID=A0A1J0AEJ7_9CYAN|nr:alpha/beta hydrolase [Gloeomargarita lithophora]APB34336.1 Putative dienelactone hydrolase [Gloeomargarita lithophora Alchichica-D10]
MFIMPVNLRIWQYGRQFFGLWALLGLALPTPPALAAERLALVTGDTTWTVTLADVTTWIDGGQPQGSLAPLAQLLAPPALAGLRDWLTRPVPLTPGQSQRLLYSEAGSQALQRLGQFFIPPDPQALKYALTLVVRQQKPITALHLLQSYPSDTVAVDALAVANVLLNAQTQQQQTAQALAAMLLLTPAGTSPPFSGQPWQAQTWVFTPPDAPQRLLKVHLFYPPGSQRVPLVLFSHGIGQTGRSLMYLGESLASQGIAAAVITHPAQSALSEFSERPQDIRRVLDYLAHHPQGQRLNLKRVGLVGHSLGGYTVLVAAGAQPQREGLNAQCQSDLALLNLSLVLLQCRALALTPWPQPAPDPRIRAVMAINPPIGGILGAEGLSSLRVPVMLIGGGQDWVTPVLPEQIQPFQGLRGKDYYLVILPSAQHLDGLDEARQFQPQRLPPIPQTFARLSREFFRTHLFPGAPPLTPARLRQPTLPLRVFAAPP